jgi:hypothetical protein
VLKEAVALALMGPKHRGIQVIERVEPGAQLTTSTHRSMELPAVVRRIRTEKGEACTQSMYNHTVPTLCLGQSSVISPGKSGLNQPLLD